MLNRTSKKNQSSKLLAKLKTLTTGLIAAGMLMAVPVSSVWAATFNVNGTEDTPGACANVDGVFQCPTLRSAIAGANGAVGEDTITLPAASIDIFATELSVEDDLIIQGQGRDVSRVNGSLIIDPNEGPADDGFLDGFEPPARIFNVSSNTNLTLRDLSVDGLRVADDDNVNTATTGGCVNIADGETVFTADNVLFEDCVAINNGGAIASGENVRLEINRSAFRGNHAFFGGAILLDQSLMTVDQSSFGPNNLGQGSAIFLGTSEATVTNSTFSGNSFGALFVSAASTLDLIHTTIVNNDGAEAINNEGFVNAENSILGPQAGGFNSCVGGVNLMGTNNIEPSGSCGLNGGPNPLLASDPLLGEFDEVGGFHPLLPGSPAIDGTPTADLAPGLGEGSGEDQIGNNRFVDGDQDGTLQADIGAIEFQPDADNSDGDGVGDGSGDGSVAGDGSGGCSLSVAGNASSGLAWVGLALVGLLGFRRARG